MERINRYRFTSRGVEYHNDPRVGGPGEACKIARESAQSNPGVEHSVHTRDGAWLATYKLVGGHMTVRMP